MDPSSTQSEDEKQSAEDALQRLGRLALQVWIAEPLPLEVEPPHVDLRRERRLSIAQVGLAVLAAIEVVHERVVRALGERTGEMQPVATGCWFPFVQWRIPRGANRLDGERRDAEEQRANACQYQAPPDQRARPTYQYGDRGRRRGEHAAHVVRVAQAEDIGDEHENAVSLASIGLVGPPNHQP